MNTLCQLDYMFHAGGLFRCVEVVATYITQNIFLT